MVEEIDEVDRKIIKMLQRDGRMSYNDIADKVEKAQSTVFERVKSLKEKGIIEIRAVVNPKKVGKRITAYLGIDVDTRKIEDITEEINYYNEVQKVWLSSGDYQIMVKVLCEDLEGYNNFLMNNLFPIEGIRDIWSTIVIKKYKDTTRVL